MAKSDALRLMPREGQDGRNQGRSLELHVSGGGAVRGSFRPPGDKSIAHRAAMLGAICEGRSFISGYPDSEDCSSTARCLQALGAGLHRDGDTLVVSGCGLRGLGEPDDVLDAGNSGTTMRLLGGLVAGQSGLFVLTGDQSLRRRPMGRITQPLRAMGAMIDGRAGGTLAPLVIKGARSKLLRACRHPLPVASAQVKSCILLAGLYAEGTTVVVEPAPSRDHTERMLRLAGICVKGGATGDVREPACGDAAPDPPHARTDPLCTSGPAEIAIEGGQVPRPFELRIPGDPSSAAFFLAAAAVLPGSAVTARHVCVNPTRLGFLQAIARMGAGVTFEPVQDGGCEPVANIHIEHQDLVGIGIPPNAIPSMIDEIPLLAVVACLAKTPSSVSGAGELRVKETNRLAAIVRELSKMGARIEQAGDSLRIWPSRLRGARVSAGGDHRMAMALAVAGLAANGTTIIEGFDCVAISYRSFVDDLASLLGQRHFYEGTSYR